MPITYRQRVIGYVICILMEKTTGIIDFPFLNERKVISSRYSLHLMSSRNLEPNFSRIPIPQHGWGGVLLAAGGSGGDGQPPPLILASS